MSRYPHPADMNPDSSDPRSPYYDDSREEWIDERADELLHEYAKDEAMVSDELGHFFTLGAGDQLERALLRFFMSFDQARTNEAMALAGTELYQLLDGHVTAELKGRAETDAELERVQWEAEQAEMRDHYRGAAKSNGNASAYPRGIWDGLTKREAFAMAAMQGILGNAYWNEHGDYTPVDVAKSARDYADALLVELTKDGAP